MTALLLVNLGSPDSFAVSDVRRYLDEFLMDKYVIDVPAPVRSLIVRGFILPFRPRRSAAAYRSIWWDEGSPLTVLSRRLAQAVQKEIALPTALGMRYGNPSIQSAMENILEEYPDVKEIILAPLYPQYAMATTKTVVEKACEALATVEKKMNKRVLLKVVPPFYNDPRYISALAASARDGLRGAKIGCDIDMLLLSYHGVPERHIRKTDRARTKGKADKNGGYCLLEKSTRCCDIDCERERNRSEEAQAAHEVCYRHHAAETSRLLAQELGLGAGQWRMSFQSRLGSDAWLKPYTADELKRLPSDGVKRLAVICPAFVSDCLETLEEIGEEGREIFLRSGGESFTLIPCLNDREDWAKALAAIVLQTEISEPRARATSSSLKATPS